MLHHNNNNNNDNDNDNDNNNNNKKVFNYIDTCITKRISRYNVIQKYIIL